jgi:Domain of unknown function (DUF4294)
MNNFSFYSAFLLRFAFASFTIFIEYNATFAQSDTIEIDEVTVRPQTDSRYEYELARLREIYPLAIHAKTLIEAYDDELAVIEKKRKKRKFTREAHQKLKDDFYWSIRDMYDSDGKLLMKLVHRETGLTVADILEKYRGKVSSGIYENMAKLFDQDLNIKYDPTNTDLLTEHIITKINNKLIPFDFTPKIKTKAVAKESLKEYRKEYRKEKKEARKEKRAKRRKD